MSIVTGSFSPDGATFVTGDLFGDLREWMGGEGHHLGAVEAPGSIVASLGSPLGCVTFSPDGSLLAASTGSVVVLLAARGWTRVGSWSNHRNPVSALAISPDNRRVAVGSMRQGVDSLRVWRLEDGAPVEGFSDHRHVGGVSSVRFSPDSRFLVAGGFKLSGYTGPIVYDVETGEGLGAFYYDLTQALDWSPDGTLIATGDDIGWVKLWDAPERSLLFKEEAHAASVGVVRFSPDGRSLATGDVEGGVGLWSVQERTLVARHSCGGSVLAAVFAGDGERLLVAAAREGAARPEVRGFPSS